MLRSKRDLKLLSKQIEREPNLVGTWINELGSRMQIDSVDDGLITGTYWSKVSAEQDPVCGDLTGMVAGDTIGFAVNWQPTFNSITSWSGKLLATDQDTPTSSHCGTYRTTPATPPTGGNPSCPVPIRSGSSRMRPRTNSRAPKPGNRQTLAQVVKYFYTTDGRDPFVT
ncbi:MAG: avidin/streptavidin family protein [Bradyrhizobium sp.]